MGFKVIIPARYASTRLPGKPLLKIAGKPMIQHVYEQAMKSAAESVIIATDDERVESAAIDFGATVCMTSPDHESGTDRLQEVVSKLALDENEIVINVQGDEPLIPPVVINQVANNLATNSHASVSTLCEPIFDIEQVMNPNVVKVVFDCDGYALYFSRAPIPWSRDQFAEQRPMLPEGVDYYRHIGIYGYRVALLNDFVQWPLSRLESTEKLEQLRVMANGARIHVAQTEEEIPGGVDTEEDLLRVQKLMEND